MRSEYQAGSKVALQFRVNKHGPKPFRLAFSESGDETEFSDPSNVLVDNLVYEITAEGGDAFNGFEMTVTMPNVACDNCALQLSGMGPVAGGGEWYNCANIRLTKPECPDMCDKNGSCNESTGMCTCDNGWSGTDCMLATGSSGEVQLRVTLQTGEETDAAAFDRDAFVASVAESLAIDPARVEIGTVAASAEETTVTFTIQDAPEEDVSAEQAATLMMSQMDNEQLNLGYQVTMIESPSMVDEEEEKKGGKGGVIAAAILVPLCLIGVAVGGVFVMKKKGMGPWASVDNAAPQATPGSGLQAPGAPPVPARV